MTEPLDGAIFTIMEWRRSASWLSAVTFGLVLVAACSGSGSSGADSPPLSIAEYDTTVNEAVEPVDSALKRLAKAEALKGLAGQVDAVETAADQALTELNEVAPAPEVAAEHDKLVSALEAFVGDLEAVKSQVGKRALCTGSAVWASLGDAAGTSALREASAAVYEKLPKDPGDLKLPAAGQKPDARPKNGKLLRESNLDGYHELMIDNGGSDAVVTLSKGSKPVLSMFIRKNQRATAKGVRDGTYTVFFTSGSRWDKEARAFGRNCAFQRVEKKAEFKTEDGLAMRQTYTLYPVAGGDARTQEVDPDEFPNS